MILNSPYISGSLTVTGNIITSGSITISGSIASASYATNAELLDGLDSTAFATTGAYSATSASLYSTSASLSATSGSLSTASGSFNTRVTALEATGSALTSSLLTVSGSGYATSASLSTASGSFNSRVATIESKYATTGSNNFRAPQYISDTTVPTGFSNTTGSIYTDGGIQVTKDSYFSSSMFIKGNLTIYGTQSIAYITSSQLNIATNLITVNTATPAVRFGGLAVYDSGSTGTNMTGSLLWDSQNNGWVYQRESGSTYAGGMLISGPRRALGSNLGDEQGLTACMIPVAQGGDHITSSLIYHDSSVTCIQTAVIGTSTACFAGVVCSNGNVLIGGSGTANYLPKFTGTSTIGNSGVYDNGTNILIGKTTSTGGLVQISNGTNMYNFDYDASGPYFTTVNNANTVYKRFTLDASELYFNIAASTKMILNASGNLGLGVTPSYKLDVAGSFNFTTGGNYLTYNSGILYHGNYYQYPSGNDYLLFARASGALILGSNDTEKMRITSGGNVLIGTTTDSGYKLDVNGTGRFSDDLTISKTTANLRLFINNTTATTGRSWYFNSYSNGNLYAGNTTAGDIFNFSSTGAATFSSTITGTTIYGSTMVCAASLKAQSGFADLVLCGSNTTSPHIGGTFTITTNQDGNGRTIIGNAAVGRAMYLEAGGTFTFLCAATFSGNALTVSGDNPALTVSTSNASLYSYIALTGGTSSNYIYTLANSYNTTGPYVAGALTLVGTTSGGISIAATCASGLIRFYTCATERMRITSDGVVSINPGAAFNFRSYQTAGSTTGLTVSNGIPRNSTNNEANHVMYIGSCDAVYPIGMVIGFRSHTTDYTCRFPYIIATQIGQTPNHMAFNPDGGGVSNIFIHTYTADCAGWTFVGSSPGYGVTRRSGTGGQSHISFQNDNGQVGYISTSGTSTTFSTNGSDIRCKKNFETWNENASSLFTDILPMKFNYIVECEGIQKTKGFIAQCMVNKFPEAYPTNECGTYSFNPSGMVVYLMKAIQELKAENDIFKTCLGIS